MQGCIGYIYTLLIDFQIALDHLPEIQTSESGDHVKRFAAGFSPVRITPYFVEPLSSTFRPQLTSPSGALMKMLSLLTNTLLVRQISGNMKIPPSCSEYTYGPNIGKCRVIHSTTYCGSYTVPRQFIGTREVCSTSYGPCRESGINGTGAANTDFLLFVGTQCKFISRVCIPSLTIKHSIPPYIQPLALPAVPLHLLLPVPWTSGTDHLLVTLHCALQ